jgi:hypothetical protein
MDMSSGRGEALTGIIEISQRMLVLARQNQWGSVAELESERKLLVEACFKQPTPEQDSPQVAAAIREVLRINQELVELGGRWRQFLGTEIHTHNQGRAAAAAYRSHAR